MVKYIIKLLIEFYEKPTVKIIKNMWITYYMFYRGLLLLLPWMGLTVTSSKRIQRLEQEIFGSALENVNYIEKYISLMAVLLLLIILSSWCLYRSNIFFKEKRGRKKIK